MMDAGVMKRALSVMEEGHAPNFGASPYGVSNSSAGSFSFALCPQTATASPRLPEVIDFLVREGQCIRWDCAQGFYEVIDGSMFEQKINASRLKRRDDATDHPSAYYAMVRGERWGATGSAFRLKRETLQHGGFMSDAVYPTGQPQLAVHEGLSPSPGGPYGSFSDNSTVQPFFAMQRHTSSDPDLNAKRFRSAEEHRVVSGAQQPAGFPLAVSFSDALSKFDKQDREKDRCARDIKIPISGTQAGVDCLSDGTFTMQKPKTEIDNEYRDDERDEGFPGSDHGSYNLGGGANSKQICLRLPELIDTLAKEGQVLRWDDAQRLYEVVDGPAFEEKFNALRFKRGKRREEAQHRPFARMHIHFILVRGDKWGGTGSAFRPKGDSQKECSGTIEIDHRQLINPLAAPPSAHSQQCLPTNPSSVGGFAAPGQDALPINSPNQITADMVQIHLKSSVVPGGFQCTLQHFLDVTGAGELYSRYAGKDCESVDGARPLAQNWHDGFVPFHAESDSSSMNSGFTSSASDSPSDESTPDVMLEGGFAPEKVLNERDIAGIVGTMWHDNSLGDQAYFFPRGEGADAPFFNGAIVALVDGKLSARPVDEETAIYMVVSDNNAKWKGEPIPTPEEEKLGHWCAFLGQVPVHVAGPVRCGDYIGPAPDGSGLGIVTTLGAGPVIGIALAGKESDVVGVVKTLCFAGFNALTPLGADFKRLFLQARELQSSVEALRRGVEACENSISVMTATADDRDEEMRSLRARLELVEGIAVPRAGHHAAASCGALDAAVIMEFQRQRADLLRAGACRQSAGGGCGRGLSWVLVGVMMIACLALAANRGGTAAVAPAAHHHLSRRHVAGAESAGIPATEALRGRRGEAAQAQARLARAVAEELSIAALDAVPVGGGGASTRSSTHRRHHRADTLGSAGTDGEAAPPTKHHRHHHRHQRTDQSAADDEQSPAAGGGVGSQPSAAAAADQPSAGPAAAALDPQPSKGILGGVSE